MSLDIKDLSFFISACLLVSCGNEEVKEEQYTFNDLLGQWTMMRVDTIESKQSIEVNEKYNNSWVEYDRSEIEVLDGVVKCVRLCPQEVPVKEIEFANDSVFEYCFPTHLRAENKMEIANNKLALKGINSIWSDAESNLNVSMSPDKDTLRIEYLENTGLYLSEVYIHSTFDQKIVSIVRAYGQNLPFAQGKYKLVHSDFQSVDYDSPFEHYHSFPHKIPETLEFSEEDLLQILKDTSEFQMLTDGKLMPYDLSWSWGKRFWIMPKDWYEGPATSAMILFEKVD